VVGYEPGRHFAYVLLSGLDVRNYRADVTLTPTAEGGSTIEWRSSFERGRWASARVMRWALRRFIRRVASSLAAVAERPEIRGGVRP
jgi:hypothetical protein